MLSRTKVHTASSPSELTRNRVQRVSWRNSASAMVIAAVCGLLPSAALAQTAPSTISVNNTSGRSAGSYGFFLDRPSGAHVVYGQAFTALHPTLESYSIRAFSELVDNPNTRFRGAVYEFDTATMAIASNTPIFSSGLFDHPAVPVNGNHNFVVNTSSLALTTGRTYAAFIGADYASFRADTSITGLERFFLNTTANLAPGATTRTLFRDNNNPANSTDTTHPLTDFNFGFVEACDTCDAWSTLTAGNVAVPLNGELSQTNDPVANTRTTIFSNRNTYFNFIYTPAPSSDISGTGSFLTSGLGTSVNPVFAGGTLTGAATGTFAQNFTVTPAAGSAINTNGNALTFSGTFTNGTPGTPGNLGISGAGSATFTGSFGSETNRFGGINNTGSMTIGGTGTSWFNGNSNSGTFNILQGATVHNALNNTGTFNNAGAYFSDLNNSTAAGIITNTATGVWTGNVLTNTTGANITNSGTWNGNIVTNSSQINNGTIWNGNVLANTGLISNDAGATWTGDFTNSAGGTVNNRGTIVGGVTNSGVFNNIGTASRVTGNLTNLAGGALARNFGTWTGNATNSSIITNETGGIWVGNGTNLASGTINNSGTWTGTINNAGTLNNNAGSSVSGLLTQTAGVTTNAGALNGGANITGGTLTTTGTISGGLTNAAGATTNAAGVVNGAVSNAGTFNVTGALTGNNSFLNSGTGTLNVTGGNYTGLTQVNNSSTAATGINIASGRTLSSTGITNAVGATIVNAGTLTSTNQITNNGTLTTTGTVNGGVNNTAGATVNAAGTFNGTISNSGTFNVTGALNVLPAFDTFINNGTGRLNVTGGNYTGLNVVINNATAADGINIASGRTLGAQIITNNAGASIVNSGTINTVLRVDNRGTLTSTGTINSGSQGYTTFAGSTTNASGAINGVVANSGTFNVTGALTGNNSFTNSGTGTLNVTGGNYTGLTSFTNSSTAAIGVDVAATRTLSAQTITNNVGSTIRNAGTLSASGGITNSGTLNSTGAIIGALVNNGTANLAGTFNFNLTNQNAGIMNIIGNFTGGGGGFIGSGTSVTTLSNGATWSGLFNLNNTSTNTSGLNLNGTLTAAGAVFTQSGATTTIGSTGIVTATNGLNVSTGGTLINSGRINSGVSTAGTFTSTGQALGGLTVTGGTASVRGVVNGAITNAGVFAVTGNLASDNTLSNTGTGRVTVNAGANWTGLTSVTNSSTAATGLQINGALTMTGGALLITTGGATTRVGTGGALTVGNPTSAFNIQLNGGGIFVNDGTVTGGVTSRGTLTSNGNWTGTYEGSAGSVTTNNGTWNGASNVFYFTSHGLFTNNGTVTASPVSANASTGGLGTFINAGTYTQTTVLGVASRAFSGGLIDNRGTWTGNLGTEGTAGSRILNSGTINGNLTIRTGGIGTNAATGTLNGTATNDGGGALVNAGTITGLVTNAGTANSTGTLGGGLINTGAAQVAGTANGAITNQGAGALTVTGNLASNGALTNRDTGRVTVNAGSVWTGLTAITNTSTNAAGITVDGTLTTTGLLSNGAGSFVTVNAGGTLNAGSVNNAEGGLITVALGGTVNDALTNNGVVNNAGVYNADVNNSGALAVIANQATGIWTGNLLSNLASATITNDGLWIGSANNSALLTNSANGIWAGNITNNVGGTLSNQGLIAGSVTNAGSFSSTNMVDGGLINTGTANVQGTLNGAIANTGGNLTVTGNLSSNSALVNSAAGMVTVNAGAVWSGLTSVSNDSGNLVVNGTLSTGGTLANMGNGTILLSNGATLTANAITGTTFSTITVNNGATVNGATALAGTILNAGTFNGDVSIDDVSAGAWYAWANNAADGVWNGNILSNTGAGYAWNAGTWNGNVNSSAFLSNFAGATWVGNATNNAPGIFSNDGTWTGTVTNAGSFNNNGSVSGLVINSGTLQTSNLLSNGLNNSGTALLQGVVNGPINNSGNVIVTGALTSNGALSNTGSGTVTVNTGSVWTGLTGITNSSNNINGLLIGGSLRTVGNVTNGAGSTIRVFNGGLLVAANITNAATGQILVSQGGTVIDDLNNSGIVVSAGSYTANVNNSGNAAVINNLATGVWTGNLLTNAGGATVTNEGTWTGSANNAANLANLVGGTWIGGLTNLVGAVAQNAGTWNGAVTNAGSLTNFATGTVTGLVVNSGTVNSAGTFSNGLTNTATANVQGVVNGSILNQNAGTMTVTGGLTGNGTLTNSGNAQLMVTGGNFTGITTLTNTSANAMGVGIAATRTLSVGTLINAVGSTLVNQGTLTTSAGTTNAGTLSSTGTINGALTNAAGGTVQAQGAINGAISNSGQFIVTGALTGNGTLTNSGNAQLMVTGGNFTGITTLTNTSANAMGVGIAATRTLSVGTLTNAAGSTLVNQGTVTTSAGTTNAGTLSSTGTINGALTNAAGGTVLAQGAINGLVGNSGQFLVTGALTGNGAAFNNLATGVLSNQSSSYSGLGAISNAAGGRIVIGTATASVSGASLVNSGSVEMMNGRVGDRVTLSGAFSGVAGSQVTVDVNMASNANLSDRIIAASATGTTVVSILNTSASRGYFNSPIVIISGATDTSNFVAANDATTRAALSRNGIVTYSARKLAASNDWGIVASVDSAMAGSIASDTLAFAGLGNAGLIMTAESLTAGEAQDDQWSTRIWGRYGSANQDVTTNVITTDPFGTNVEQNGALNSNGFRLGGALRLIGSEAVDLDIGIAGGVSRGTVVQNNSGVTTRFEMPVYGGYAVLSSKFLRVDVRYEVLDLDVDPDNMITADKLDGKGYRLQGGVGVPVSISVGMIEPYLNVERLSVDIDSATLIGGLGSFSFGTQKSDRYQGGLQGRFVIPGKTWTLRPSFDLSLTQEDGSAVSLFTPVGGVGSVGLASGRDSSYFGADMAISVMHNSSGFELFAQGSGRSGSDVSGSAVTVGARLKF